MRTIKNICILLLFVGTSSALPQQQGGQVPASSQCAPNQACVPFYLCKEDGYINTDGSGLIAEKTTLKGTCTYHKDPDVIAICCNKPGVPKPPPVVVVPPPVVDVCPCTDHKPCPNSKVCVAPELCDNSGNIITDGSGLIREKGATFQQCSIGETGKVGVCCTPPSSEYHTAVKCGVRNDKQVPGQNSQSNNEALFGEFPWQAILFVSNEKIQCGASVIHKQWLVTAAHCVNDLKPADLTVRLGEWNRENFNEPKPFVDISVADIKIHPDFKENNLHNDIAVVQLVQPLEFQYHINSICLPKKGQTFWGQRCIATGWGEDALDGKHPHIMKKIELPTIEANQCQDFLQKTRLGEWYALDDSFMCAGGEENKDACKGDGGGPLACKDPVTEQYVLTGITAFGIDTLPCGEKDVPGVYADVQALLPFIKNVCPECFRN